MKRFVILLAIVLSGSAGCSVDVSALKDEPCGAGSTEPCACDDGTTGERQCTEKGVFGKCVCASSGDSGGTGDPGASSGGSYAGQGGTAGEGMAGHDGGWSGEGDSGGQSGAGGEAGETGEAGDGGIAEDGGAGIDGGWSGEGGTGGQGGAGGEAGAGGDGGTLTFCEALGPCCPTLLLPPLVASCLLAASAGTEAQCEQYLVSICP